MRRPSQNILKWPFWPTITCHAGSRKPRMYSKLWNQESPWRNNHPNDPIGVTIQGEELSVLPSIGLFCIYFVGTSESTCQYLEGSYSCWSIVHSIIRVICFFGRKQLKQPNLWDMSSKHIQPTHTAVCFKWFPHDLTQPPQKCQHDTGEMLDRLSLVRNLGRRWWLPSRKPC